MELEKMIRDPLLLISRCYILSQAVSVSRGHYLLYHFKWL